MKHYEKRGPKAIILFHAYTSNPLDVLSLGRALARENYTVIMPTLAGHALEDPEKILNYGIEDWKKDGEKAYQKLVDDGYENISAFGLSLGGLVATHLMLAKDLKSYGAFSSPLMPNQKTNIRNYFWKWYKEKKEKLGISEEEVEEDYSFVMKKLDKILFDMNEYVKEMAENYGQVRIATFLGQGQLDKMLDPIETKKLAKKFKKAKVDFHCYKKGAHVITIGRVGKALQKDLLAFLDKNV